MQRLGIVKIMLKKNKFGSLTPRDFKTYYKITVNKIVFMKGKTNHWNIT